MDLKEAEILGDAVDGHWYYRSKALALAALLHGRRFRALLDVGAGSGFFSRWLLGLGTAAAATCVDPGYARESDEQVQGGPIAYRRAAVAPEADLILLMDVLEHVEDDAGLLRGYADAARPGTTFLISVPAFPLLWSAHDRFLGHRRRYTRSALLACAAAAGLEVRVSCYFFALVLPLAAAARLFERLRPRPPASQLKPHAPLVNRLLAGLCRLELPLLRHNRVAGLTIFCECVKAG